MSSPGDRQQQDLRRRALVFSVLGLLFCIVLVGVFEPAGWGAERGAALELFERVRTGGARIGWSHVPALVIVGLIAGVLAGLLGMAGGVLQIAGMLLIMKMDVLLARAVSLTTMVLATYSATRVHVKNGTVLAQLVRPMVLPSVVGVLSGVVLGSVLPRVTLSHFFALFALFLAFSTLAQSFADPNEHVFSGEYPKVLTPGQRLMARSIGGVHGFMCGLLGISGGVIALPLQQVLLSVPVRHAAANTVAISAFATTFGSVAAVSTGAIRQDFALGDVLFATLWMGGGALIGAPIGAHLNGTIRVVYLKLMFVQLSLSAGLLILLR
jgi:uncharacterized membrane protein YfcA